MSTQLECSARASLCMRLAKREPANRILWMGEAEHWSRLSKERLWRGRGGDRSRPSTDGDGDTKLNVDVASPRLRGR